MKHLRLALFAYVAALGLAHAQDDEERRAPPTEIPDFSNLDEYTYEPKSALIWGIRRLSGAKLGFSGGGKIKGAEDAGDATTPNIVRNYHDGFVAIDGRTTARVDSSGNPATDPQSGAVIADPIAPDGRTNSWRYFNNNQVTEDGYLVFHNYSADIVDTTVHDGEAEATNGLELSMIRDMGSFFGGKASWKITAGASLNDINGQATAGVNANIHSLTDYYSLYGAVVPEAPYSSPSTRTDTVVDSNGNAVLNANGVPITVTTDTSILISSSPDGRGTVTTNDSTSVINRWKVKGAFFTFRLGPTVDFKIIGKLRASVSVGGALAFAGSNYTVTETLTPEFGAEISETETSAAYKLLPGYYVDATLHYDLTDRAGFYAGAVFQSTGSYDQKIESADTSYSTKVDLANLNGLRAGMAIRF